MIVCFVFLLVCVSPCYAELIGYIGTSGGDIHYIDFETGSQSRLNVFYGSGSPDRIDALEYSAIDEVLYMTGIQRLYRIDIESQRGYIVKEYTKEIKSLAFAPDETLYGIRFGRLVSIDVENGNLSDVGNLGGYGIEALAISPEGRAIGWAYAGNFLVEVDLSNAFVTELGLISGHYDALDFGPDDNLYGWEGISLYQINIDTLARMDVGYAVRGDAFVLIPEPNTLLFFILGIIFAKRTLRI